MPRSTLTGRSLGRVRLTPSRRLAVTLYEAAGARPVAPIVDLRLQIAADGRWQQSKQGIAVEAAKLPELLAVLQSAIEPS